MASRVDIAELIARGETERQAFRADVEDSESLAKDIAGFANVRGGVILVGVRPPQEVVGCDRHKVSRYFNSALKRLRDAPEILMEFRTVNGKEVGVIAIPKAAGLVYSRDGVFLRPGGLDMTVSAADLGSHGGMDTSMSMRDLADLIQHQARTIVELTKRIEASNHWKCKCREYLIAGMVGAILGYAVYKLGEAMVHGRLP